MQQSAVGPGHRVRGVGPLGLGKSMKLQPPSPLELIPSVVASVVTPLVASVVAPVVVEVVTSLVAPWVIGESRGPAAHSRPDAAKKSTHAHRP